MVAAMCMVLYGYDASVFNSVQGSDNWLEYFDLDAVSAQRQIESFEAPLRDMGALLTCSERRKRTHTRSA